MFKIQIMIFLYFFLTLAFVRLSPSLIRHHFEVRVRAAVTTEGTPRRSPRIIPPLQLSPALKTRC